MATKIRLQRGGRKGYAFYSIVIADARAPRDGRWVETGAQPTDTVRNILSREGVYLMKHLKGGVKKGAFDEATCQKKFDAWKADKQNGLAKIAEAEAKAKKEAAAEALKAEKAVNEAIAKKVADKKAAEAAAKAEAEAAEAATEEAAAEAPAAEEAPAEA